MEAAKYTINFNNGRAYAVELPIGKYRYDSNTIRGYHSCTVSDFEVGPDTKSVTLKIQSDGRLTVNVTDADNQPITAGLLQLCNHDASEFYGLPVRISNGTAVFSNVPHTIFGGIEFYVKQHSSDAQHVPADSPVKVTMTEAEQTLHIINAAKKMNINFSVRDANYAGIVPINSSITFT